MKTKALIILSIFTCLVLNSCEKEKEKEEVNQMIGVWDVREIYINDVNYYDNSMMDMVPALSCMKNAMLTFKEDLTVQLRVCDINDVATYTYSDNSVCVKEATFSQCADIADYRFTLEVPPVFIIQMFPALGGLEDMGIDIVSLKATFEKRPSEMNPE